MVSVENTLGMYYEEKDTYNIINDCGGNVIIKYDAYSRSDRYSNK